MLQDLRYAVRTLISRPGFAAMALVTLALGIGATTAIFSVVNGVLLRPLELPDADGIVNVRATNPEAGFPESTVSPLNFRDFRDQTRAFESMVALRRANFTLTGDESPERVRGSQVSAGYFRLMRAEPVRGRGFQPAEDQPGGERVAVISHALWQRRFAGDPAAVGRTLLVNGEPRMIVGIAPEEFGFPASELWVPIGLDFERIPRNDRMIYVFGRLRPEVSLAEAQADLDRVTAALAQAYPDTNTGWGATAYPLKEIVVRGVRPALLVLLAAVALVLLIAVVNVANLSLARLTTRQREVAIRYALGASRRRLVRQFLTESVVLSVLGGGLGLLLAIWGTEALIAHFGGYIPRAEAVTADSSVLVFTLLVAVGSGLLCGLLPAFQASRRRLADPMRAGRSLTPGAGSGRLRQGLVGLEVALALVLLIGASLLIRSFANLVAVDPGFSPANLLTMEIELPEESYGETGDRVAFQRALRERLAALPGASGAGTISPLPLSGIWSAEEFAIEGRAVALRDAPVSNYRVASPGYFETMEIPLLRGRYLTPADVAGARPVMVVNQTLAMRFFPQEEALGRRITFDVPATEDSEWITIVGVVGDVRWGRLHTEAGPELYLSAFQQPEESVTVVVRAAGDPTALVAAVREAVRAVDPNLPLFNVRTGEEIVARHLGQPQFSMTLLALFAAVAMALAAVGIYGVVSYSVSQRGREIGIRMALGASAEEVLRMVVVQGMAPVVAGLVAGFAGAFGLTRFLASQIYEVSTTDPLSFAAVALVLLAAALVASFLPARRATAVEPVAVLRHE